MKKQILMMMTLLVSLSLLTTGLAEVLTLDGTTDAASAVTVYASVGGTAEAVPAQAGQVVESGDVLFTLQTVKVYAETDGTVSGVFGMPGDAADTVVNHYGAILYLEEESVYTISASVKTAYSAPETKLVHTGETVYIRCPNEYKRTGVGIVTAVSGSSFTVRVTEGNFIVGDTVNCYRNASYSGSQRIGQGTIDRISPVAVTASGTIAQIAVRDGDHVSRGDLLLETLEGTYDGLAATGNDVTAPAAGVLANFSVSQGSAVQPGSAVAEIWPTDTMGVSFYVPEDFRNQVHEGDRVTVELAADENVSSAGTVTMVSAVAEDSDGETVYLARAEFTPDERIVFGMSVLVNIGEEDPPAGRSNDKSEEEPQSASQDERAPGRRRNPPDSENNEQGE